MIYKSGKSDSLQDCRRRRRAAVIPAVAAATIAATTIVVQLSLPPCAVSGDASHAERVKEHTHSGITLPLHLHAHLHLRVCMNKLYRPDIGTRPPLVPFLYAASPRQRTSAPLDFPRTGHIRECEPLFVHLVRLRASDRHLARPGTTGQEPLDVV